LSLIIIFNNQINMEQEEIVKLLNKPEILRKKVREINDKKDEFELDEENQKEDKKYELTDAEKEIMKIAELRLKHFSYNPKKDFSISYKKERKRKNKQARDQRKINRK